MQTLVALQVISLTVLNSKGIKVARLEGNRDFNPKNIKEKKKSLKEYGQMIPAVIIDAKKASDQGLKVVEFEANENGEDVEITGEGLENCFVLAEGNHRYLAHLELLKGEDYDKEFYFMVAADNGMKVSQILTEINTTTNPWKGGDYVKGAALSGNASDYPLIEAISELTSKGYSADAAAKWFTGKDGCGSKTIMVSIIGGKITDKVSNKITVTPNQLERGKKLLKAAQSSFSDGFLKSRTLADWVFRRYDQAEDDGKVVEVQKLITFLGGLDRTEVDAIEKAKGERGVTTKEQVIFNKLNELYSNAGNDQETAA